MAERREKREGRSESVRMEERERRKKEGKKKV